MNRLFVSLKIPDNIIENIIKIRNKVYYDKNVKWEPVENLHLTIKFIGDVNDEIVEDISDDLDLVTRYPSVSCTFNKFGFFYRENKPVILWAGLEVDAQLKRMIDEINLSLQKFSVPVENRKFHPHLTLLRIKNNPGNSFVNSFKNFTFEPILFTCNTITLYKSILHPEGSEYVKIKNYKLKELEK